jgi:colanic acid biosynthesis glycosyl transferase WcaI
MNTLIVTPYYPPITSTLAGMMQELAEELDLRNHHVTVATAWLPNKMSSETDCNDLSVYSNERGISVIRIRTPFLNSRNYFLRGFSQLLLPFLFWKFILRYVKKVDVIAVYTPPLTLSVIGSLVKNKFDAKVVLNVQDIFPQNAIDLGIMRNRLFIRFFEYLELNAYRSANQITSHTKRSLDFLVEQKKVPASKVHLITNWIDTAPYCNARSIDFREKFQLHGKLIFLFAGVMGPSQSLVLLIEAAIHVKRVSDEICFLFVGDGTEKARLMRMVEENSLNNVVFKPLVPLEQYPDLLKSVDVGIVSLGSLNKTPVVPAKILGYMSTSLPVAGILQKESDGHDLIREAKCGYSILSDCSSRYVADLFIKLYSERDRFTEFGENGFRYVSEHFAKDACVNKLINLLEY